MLATFKSDDRVAKTEGIEPFWHLFLVFFLALHAAEKVLAIEQASAGASAEIRLEIAFAEARKDFQTAPTNYDAAWKLSRAAFNRADNMKEGDRDRTSVARAGVEAARTAVLLNPSRAEGHYYLGLNLGEIALAKSLGALKIVKEMEQEFRKSIEINPRFDFSGAYRSLGMLYTDVPGWPLSIGNKAKGREALQKSVELHPEFPDNQITLAEAYLKGGFRKDLSEKLNAMEKQIASARKQLTGEEWIASWRDWDNRWQRVKQRLQSGDRKAD